MIPCVARESKQEHSTALCCVIHCLKALCHAALHLLACASSVKATCKYFANTEHALLIAYAIGLEIDGCGQLNRQVNYKR